MPRKILKLESSVEKAFVKYVGSKGYHCIKIKVRGWPDRFIQLNNGYGFYIEFKRAGKDAENLQDYVHSKLRKIGSHVYICDSLINAKHILLYEIIHSDINITAFKRFV